MEGCVDLRALLVDELEVGGVERSMLECSPLQFGGLERSVRWGVTQLSNGARPLVANALSTREVRCAKELGVDTLEVDSHNAGQPHGLHGLGWRQQ